MTASANPSGASVSIGVAGALGPAAIASIAVAVEAAGFHALWVNDTPGADSLAAIGAAAAATDRLVLATGVVPVDRRPAAEILAAARDLGADVLAQCVERLLTAPQEIAQGPPPRSPPPAARPLSTAASAWIRSRTLLLNSAQARPSWLSTTRAVRMKAT